MNIKIITMLLCLVGAFLQLCAFTSLEEMLIAPIEKGGYDVALLGTAARCLDRKFFLCDLMITEANESGHVSRITFKCAGGSFYDRADALSVARDAEACFSALGEKGFSHETTNGHYSASCSDVDGQGWNVKVLVTPVGAGRNCRMDIICSKVKAVDLNSGEGIDVACDSQIRDAMRAETSDEDSFIVVASSSPRLQELCKTLGVDCKLLDVEGITRKERMEDFLKYNLLLLQGRSEMEILEDVVRSLGLDVAVIDGRSNSVALKQICREVIGELNRRKRIRGMRLRRKRLTLDERVSEYKLMLTKKELGPYSFIDMNASTIVMGLVRRINGDLGIRSEFSISAGCSHGQALEKRYSITVPKMTIVKMFDYVAEQMGGTVEDCNGFMYFTFP